MTSLYEAPEGSGSHSGATSQDLDTENPLDYWSGWGDLNSRPPAPKAGALAKLRHIPVDQHSNPVSARAVADLALYSSLDRGSDAMLNRSERHPLNVGAGGYTSMGEIVC